MPKTKPNGWLRRVLWFFCRAWLLCGVITLVLGFGFATYMSIWLCRSVAAQGRVIDLMSEVKPIPAHARNRPAL